MGDVVYYISARQFTLRQATWDRPIITGFCYTTVNLRSQRKTNLQGEPVTQREAVIFYDSPTDSEDPDAFDQVKKLVKLRREIRRRDDCTIYDPTDGITTNAGGHGCVIELPRMPTSPVRNDEG